MLTILFGTRPEYIKIQPLTAKLKQNRIHYELIHISQHEHIHIEGDEQISYIKLSTSDTMTRLCVLSTEIMAKLDSVLDKTSYVLVQGDTATAFFSALTAFHKRIPIFHLEAGLRTHDIQNPFPEEAYRTMLSRIATYHLCPDVGASNNLKCEQITNNVYIVGNTVLDVIRSYNLTPTLGPEVVITIHRRENWDTLLSILHEMNIVAEFSQHLSFTWVMHPNPSIRSQISEYIRTNPVAKNITFSEPLRHGEMASKIAHAQYIITDSGGIQEEASYLGKHCFVMRKTTERDAIPPEYITLIPKIPELRSAIQNYVVRPLPSCEVYGKGTTSDQFIQIYQQIAGL